MANTSALSVGDGGELKTDTSSTGQTGPVGYTHSDRKQSLDVAVCPSIINSTAAS